ncbi:MAG: PDZ domain-containing protein [Puniceicoccales bacterium]|jgi:hypothetical protein|nr:PDZ domain-containing protein [Puniceicoccales bacterium]
MNKHIRTVPMHMLILAGLLPVASPGADSHCATPPSATAPSAIESPKPPEQEPPPAPPPAARERKTEAKGIAFLGVETVPVDAPTRQRLRLAEGTGLRVRLIAPQSPAHGPLQPGDVLVRFNDQILCNHEQLRALVRSTNPDDTVTLRIYRDGGELELVLCLGVVAPGPVCASPNACAPSLLPEVRLRLHGRDVPLNDLLRERIARLHGGVITIDPDAFIDFPKDVREKLREMHEDVQRHIGGLHGKIKRKWQHDEAATSTATTRVVDHDGSACLTTKDGARHLRFEDSEGKVVFDGPVDTPEQCAALPEIVRKKLETIEQLSGDAVQGPKPELEQSI